MKQLASSVSSQEIILSAINQHNNKNGIIVDPRSRISNNIDTPGKMKKETVFNYFIANKVIYVFKP